MGAKRSNRNKSSSNSFAMLSNIRLLSVLKGILGSIFLASIYQGSIWLMDQPIEAVRIHGTFQRVPSVRVEAALSEFLDEGILSLDLNDVRERVSAIPWAANASVRRQWPGILDVTVVEEVIHFQSRLHH